MSDSESELEFESADEGLAGGGQDVSDIDLSDLEQEDENNTEKSSKVNDRVKTPSPIKETPKKTFENAEKAEDDNEIDQIPKDTQKEVSIRGEKSPSVAKEIEVQRLDNAVDKVEGDDEIEHLLNEMNITGNGNDNEIVQETKTNVNESSSAAVVVSGWDDNELDIDDDALIEQAQVAEKPTHQIEQQQKRQLNETEKKPLSSGWSWSSFGTNIISTAVGGLNTVLETVEATIGAPGNFFWLKLFAIKCDCKQLK